MGRAVRERQSLSFLYKAIRGLRLFHIWTQPAPRLSAPSTTTQGSLRSAAKALPRWTQTTPQTHLSSLQLLQPRRVSAAWNALNLECIISGDSDADGSPPPPPPSTATFAARLPRAIAALPAAVRASYGLPAHPLPEEPQSPAKP